MLRDENSIELGQADVQIDNIPDNRKPSTFSDKEPENNQILESKALVNSEEFSQEDNDEQAAMFEKQISAKQQEGMIRAETEIRRIENYEDSDIGSTFKSRKSDGIELVHGPINEPVSSDSKQDQKRIAEPSSDYMQQQKAPEEVKHSSAKHPFH